MRLLLAALVILLVILQYSLWFGKSGVEKTFLLKRKIVAQQKANTRLFKENELLTKQVKKLKHKRQMVETIAREKMGMVKSGETYYQVVDNAK